MTRSWYGLVALLALTGSLAAGPSSGAGGRPLATARAVPEGVTARTPVETIPSYTDAVDLLYHPAAADGALVHAPVVGKQLRLLIATLNAAPVQSATQKPCSPQGHETAQVTVDEGVQRLQFEASLGACGSVRVTFGGVVQPPLVMTDALRRVLRRAAAPRSPAPPAGPLESVLRPFPHSARAATREADAALRLLHLPDSVQDSATRSVPPDDVESFGPPSVVERETTWTVAMSPQDLSDYEQGHPPRGFTYTESGTVFEDAATWSVGFTAAGNPYVGLRVTMAAQGTASSVTVNAQVFWTPPKTPAELVGAATSATLRYTEPNRPDGRPGRSTSRTLRGPALRSVLAALDGLQTEELNVAYGGAGDNGERATVRVRSRGRLVVFQVTPSSRLEVPVTADGHPQPTLQDDDVLNQAIRAAAR